MMMALDQFVFGLDELAYQQLQRSTAWRHAATSRVGARDARQYVGQGDDTISLSGLLVPEFAGKLSSLDRLRRMGDTGDAYALVDGEGKVYGAWVIERITEAQTIHTQYGRPRRIDFTVDLVRVDDQLVTSLRTSEAEDDEE